MKGFNARERRIIGAVYHDCERIALERSQEKYHGKDGCKIAKLLADLAVVRKAQILKYGCDLPRKRVYSKL